MRRVGRRIFVTTASILSSGHETENPSASKSKRHPQWTGRYYFIEKDVMAKSWKHAWKIKKVYWRIILLKPTSDAHCMQRGTASWYAEPGALATFNLQSQMELKPNNLNITELYTIQYYIIIYCIYYWWTATSPFDVFCMFSIWAAISWTYPDLQLPLSSFRLKGKAPQSQLGGKH